ncbi:MAG: saccharopine dehydrogenase NADP-binding domain-containing protein [Phycisphaerae bacterium]|nr:saccharopine dehydrogenase NADP-binding domain-containing protein [Phycisphaerae bacterium]
MQNIAIIGAGKIGRMATHMLATCGDYKVRVADNIPASVEHLTKLYPTVEGHVFDFHDVAALDRLLKGCAAVISCAPFHCNPLIAERARAARVHYLDLTEDVAVTKRVLELSHGSDTAFVPQCGLAPGFITIVATHLVRPMTDVTDLRLRVGALPRYPDNQLKYNLTWSTEGLINEYCNPCESLVDGRLVSVPAMEHLERLTIDGVEYEAFNTSGGLGTLADTLKGRVRNLNYKTIRYPGHNRLMRFLLDDLRMRDHRDELGRIFERALPTTYQDQIVIFVSATGTYRGRLTERTYAKTVFHRIIDQENWSGIQITTAAGVCAVLDLLLTGKIQAKGFVRMEQINYEDFITNRFGQYYA